MLRSEGTDAGVGDVDAVPPLPPQAVAITPAMANTGNNRDSFMRLPLMQTRFPLPSSRTTHGARVRRPAGPTQMSTQSLALCCPAVSGVKRAFSPAYDRRMTAKRSLAVLGLGFGGAQAGHLLAYQLRFGAAAQQVQA